MSIKTTTSSKAFSANFTFVRFLFSMCPHVVRQSSRMAKILSAKCTQIRLMPTVRSGVQLQVIRRGKSPLANGAFVLFLSRMHSGVSSKTRLRIETFPANVAEEMALELMAFFMGIENVFVCEGFVAF